jgi:hypothetical protein
LPEHHTQTDIKIMRFLTFHKKCIGISHHHDHLEQCEIRGANLLTKRIHVICAKEKKSGI